jgi:hypothetical protein
MWNAACHFTYKAKHRVAGFIQPFISICTLWAGMKSAIGPPYNFSYYIAKSLKKYYFLLVHYIWPLIKPLVGLQMALSIVLIKKLKRLNGKNKSR